MMGKRRLSGWRAFLLLAIGCHFSIFVFAQTEINPYNEVVSTLGVRFIPPEGWQEVEAPHESEDGLGIFLTHPQQKAVISIVWNKRLGTDQDSFHSALIEYRDTVKNTAKLISEEETTFSRVPCYVFVVELNLTTGKKRVKDYVFFKNGKAYTLTYTAPIEEFNNHLPIFEKMLETFEVVS